MYYPNAIELLTQILHIYFLYLNLYLTSLKPIKPRPTFLLNVISIAQHKHYTREIRKKMKFRKNFRKKQSMMLMSSS